MPDILSPPFAWIEIPAGQVTLIPTHTDVNYGYLKQKETFEVPAFAIAKYPITYTRYAKFIEAGWKACQEGYFGDSKRRKLCQTTFLLNLHMK